jgi:Domain of unknown function (DUF4266)
MNIPDKRARALPSRPSRILWLPAALLLSGCAAVKPYEREALSSPCMRSPFSSSALEAEYQDKLIQTRAAGGLPGDAPGGGCGCVQ